MFIFSSLKQIIKNTHDLFTSKFYLKTNQIINKVIENNESFFFSLFYQFASKMNKCISIKVVSGKRNRYLV